MYRAMIPSVTRKGEISMKQMNQEAYDGLDYVLNFFDDCSGDTLIGRARFPRTVSTGATQGRQRIVNDREEAMTYFRAALFEDCRMNAYTDYDELKRLGRLPQDYKPKPRHILIDLDRAAFQTDEELDKGLIDTIANIKRDVHIGLEPPTIFSGNGYHIHVPLKLDAAFENMPDFATFENPSIEFLRWAERRWSNGKSDPHHNPSFRSSMFRIPFTYNTKCKAAGKDPLVKVVNLWSPVDAFSFGRVNSKMINDFHAYLVQELINDKVERSYTRQVTMLMAGDGGVFRKNANTNTIAWIDKLLETAQRDNRKDVIFWILAPYLITIKGFDYDKAYAIIEAWLEKCDNVRRLEPGWRSFRYRVRYGLDTAEDEGRKPIRFDTFKNQYPEVYKSLKLGELSADGEKERDGDV